MSVGPAHFTPALFEFLHELRENNERDWFQRNRARYDSDVRDPALRFVAAAGPALHRISEHIVADPRPVGGSLFRINRDVRFSADKSPYKTAVGMSFGHDRGRQGPAPGFYLHLEPGESFAGGGVHMADGPTLRLVRDAIVGRTDEWAAIVDDPAFALGFVNMGDALRRAPQGYDPAHPRVDDLRRKSYGWHARFSEAEVCDPAFMDHFVGACRTASPFSRFLAEALGAPW
ncbi:MAG TPA: DUF2461 domain-containing protein [Candidatus Dormibacteraeota bacterium]